MMWDLIVSIPDHYLSFYFDELAAVFDDVTLSGWTYSFQKFIILTRSYVVFFFLQKFGFYRFQL